jgi:soluble lytic murein transglycosylase-like protein
MSHPSSNLDAIIREAAARHNVDPDLVRSVIHVESGFNASAVSPKGAMGLMQLMPATARQLQVANPFDAAQNVDGGVRYLKDLLANNNGDVARSLAAYNAGQKAVDRHRGIPPYKETQDYVRRITALYGRDNPFISTAAPGSPSISRSRDADGHMVFSNVD